MSKRILIVDDSRFIWEEIRMAVENTEFSIHGCAKTGEDALRMYDELQPDLVTMDVILPGIDGLETSRRILEKWPAAKIIVLSSLAYDETIEQANKIGIQGFLFKPFSREELLELLQKSV